MATFDYDRLYTERHEQVMAAIKTVHDRLDLLNGRTRTSEQHIAVLSDRYTRTTAISWSSVGAIVVGALYYLIMRL